MVVGGADGGRTVEYFSVVNRVFEHNNKKKVFNGVPIVHCEVPFEALARQLQRQDVIVKTE